MSEKILMFKCSLPTTRMEEEGISNVYIDDLMNKISKTFCGTFSIDNIPVIGNDVFSVIVNLSKQNEKGTHFIAMTKLKGKIIYFDSFGNPNIDIALEKYLKTYEKQIIYSNNQLQNIFSSHCGFYCIAFILSIENNITFNEFLRKFNRKNLYLNDYICVEMTKFFINHIIHR